MIRHTGGLAFGCDLDEIELRLAGDGERLREGSDPQLLAVLGDQQHFAGTDAVVDPGFVCGSDVGITSPTRDPPAGRRRLVHVEAPRRAAMATESKRTTRTRRSEPAKSRRDRPGRPGGRIDERSVRIPLPNWIVVARYQAHEQPLDSIRRTTHRTGAPGPRRAAPRGGTAGERDPGGRRSRRGLGRRPRGRARPRADAGDARPARRHAGRDDRRPVRGAAPGARWSCTSGLAAERPESLGQAAIAIDAMAALVEGLGDRLEPNAAALRQVLSQRPARVRRGVAEGAPDRSRDRRTFRIAATVCLRRPARRRHRRGQGPHPGEGVLGATRRGRRDARHRRHDARRRAHHVRLHRPVPFRHPADPGRQLHDHRHARDRRRQRAPEQRRAVQPHRGTSPRRTRPARSTSRTRCGRRRSHGPDVAELYWKWVGEDHPTIGLVTATLHVPPGPGRGAGLGPRPAHRHGATAGRHGQLARTGRSPGNVRRGAGRDSRRPAPAAPGDVTATTRSHPRRGAFVGGRGERRAGAGRRGARGASEPHAGGTHRAGTAAHPGRHRRVPGPVAPVRQGTGAPEPVGEYFRDLPDDPPAVVVGLMHWGAISAGGVLGDGARPRPARVPDASREVAGRPDAAPRPHRLRAHRDRCRPVPPPRLRTQRHWIRSSPAAHR